MEIRSQYSSFQKNAKHRVHILTSNKLKVRTERQTAIQTSLREGWDIEKYVENNSGTVGATDVLILGG